ncbi:MAG: hypothetical protein JRF30_05785 [Deltaproteobacteria bacterium]|nr:hypothetical protein [Deltaproteobacteria bacterium]MBW2330434.1 hypothetical protein [Deltaproteobacteria bacterium]
MNNVDRKCDYCGSSTLIPVLKSRTSDFSNKYYYLFQCQKCELICADLHLEEIDLANIYYDEHDDTIVDKSQIYDFLYKCFFYLYRNIGKGNGKWLLDVGAGNGSFMKFAQSLGWKVFWG